MLRLGHGQAVARDDDDLARERELHGDVFRGGRPHRAAVVDPGRTGSCLHLAERAEDHVRDGARFIAFAISSVRSVPAAPTSAPATISTVESSTKPVAGPASPVKAFRSEITTGMSAPPIRANITPKSSARAISAIRAHSESTPATRAMPRAAAPSRIAELKRFWPENTIGRPDRLLQLREGDERAGEGDRADQRRENDRDDLVAREGLH